MTPATLILLIPIAYVALQLVALRSMRNGWQWAAALPAVAMGAALLVYLVGIVTNAASSSLWLMMGLPVATLYLLLLFPMRWILARSDA
ncbi:MAG: hypothetical protein AAFR35_07915 [Pseudomonadota bacterium]